MKKQFLSCVMILALLLCLAACGTPSAADFMGTWTYTTLQTKDLGFDDGSMLDVTLITTLTLNGDESYTITANFADEDYDAIKESLRTYLFDSMDTSTLSQEEIIAQLEEEVGMDIDSFIDSAVESIRTQYASSVLYSGEWCYENEMIYLDKDTDNEAHYLIDGDSIYSLTGERYTRES